jgi:hypothetical protein
MDDLDFLNEEIGEHEPSFVEHSLERPAMDWDRLRDADSDYDEILFIPNIEF